MPTATSTAMNPRISAERDRELAAVGVGGDLVAVAVPAVGVIVPVTHCPQGYAARGDRARVDPRARGRAVHEPVRRGRRWTARSPRWRYPRARACWRPDAARPSCCRVLEAYPGRAAASASDPRRPRAGARAGRARRLAARTRGWSRRAPRTRRAGGGRLRPGGQRRVVARPRRLPGRAGRARARWRAPAAAWSCSARATGRARRRGRVLGGAWAARRPTSCRSASTRSWTPRAPPGCDPSTVARGQRPPTGPPTRRAWPPRPSATTTPRRGRYARRIRARRALPDGGSTMGFALLTLRRR